MANTFSDLADAHVEDGQAHAAIHSLMREVVQKRHDMTPAGMVGIARHYLLQQLDLIECRFCVMLCGLLVRICQSSVSNDPGGTLACLTLTTLSAT